MFKLPSGMSTFHFERTFVLKKGLEVTTYQSVHTPQRFDNSTSNVAVNIWTESDNSLSRKTSFGKLAFVNIYFKE